MWIPLSKEASLLPRGGLPPCTWGPVRSYTQTYMCPSVGQGIVASWLSSEFGIAIWWWLLFSQDMNKMKALKWRVIEQWPSTCQSAERDVQRGAENDRCDSLHPFWFSGSCYHVNTNIGKGTNGTACEIWLDRTCNVKAQEIWEEKVIGQVITTWKVKASSEHKTWVYSYSKSTAFSSLLPTFISYNWPLLLVSSRITQFHS